MTSKDKRPPGERHEPRSQQATGKLLHELPVVPVDRERQDDELRLGHVELDASRARFLQFYDLAPTGYCTVGESGRILEANLTLASLLDVARGELLVSPRHSPSRSS